MAVNTVSTKNPANEMERYAFMLEQRALEQKRQQAAAAKPKPPLTGHPTTRMTAPQNTPKPAAGKAGNTGHSIQNPTYDGESLGLARGQAALQQRPPLTTSHGAEEAREAVPKEAALAPFQLVRMSPPASIAAPGRPTSSNDTLAGGTQPLHAVNATDSGHACGIGGSGLNIGGTAGATVEIGAPGLGSLGGTVSAGGGPFVDDGRTSFGGFFGYGGVANGATSSEYPSASEIKEHGLAGVFGMDAGIGGGLYATNACSAKELGGPFDTFTATTRFGSVQLGVSGGSVFDALAGKEGVTFIGSATFGKGQGWAVSAYPTDTRWASEQYEPVGKAAQWAGDVTRNAFSSTKDGAVIVGTWAVDQFWDRVPRFTL